MDDIEIRNPQANANGTVECEVRHPKLGWIPYTASETEPTENGIAIWAKLQTMGVAEHVPMTLEQELEAWRPVARTDRTDFCIRLAQAEIVTDEEAIEASQGVWPAPFLPAIASLPKKDQTAARIKWATLKDVLMNDPLVGMLKAFMNLEDAQVDGLFADDPNAPESVKTYDPETT